MRCFYKIAFLFFLGFNVASCYYVAPDNHLYTGRPDPCGFSKSSHNDSIKWDTSKFPISFYAHSSVSTDAYRNFVSATEHWNDAWMEYLEARSITNKFLLFKIGGEGYLFSGTPGVDGSNMLFFLDDFDGYSNKPNSIQALTSTISAGGRLEDTDILVNEEHNKYYFDRSYDSYVLSTHTQSNQYRTFASTSQPSFWENAKDTFLRLFYFAMDFFKIQEHVHRDLDARRISKNLVDFPSLIIHELGHALGLAHIPIEDEKSDRLFSIMERVLPKGRTRRVIGSYDLDNLFCGYYEYN